MLPLTPHACVCCRRHRSLLGYDNLLPNQASLLTQQSAWYTANVMEEFGLPLNSRKLFTKDDWMTFLAATYYNANGTPSAFSNSLVSALAGWQAACQRARILRHDAFFGVIAR